MAEIRTALNLKGRDFYQLLREEPALKERYYSIQQDRADMMFDEAYQIGTDNDKDPRIARVQADIRMKIGAAYDRKRFGEKIGVELDAGPNLVEALQAARKRIALPLCDPAPTLEAEYSVIPDESVERATDIQSDEPTSEPLDEATDDPFGLRDRP